MEIEKRLNKHLKRLNRAIQKMVAQAPEFGELRKMLREERVELAVYVVPLLNGKAPGEDMKYGLTDADRRFLKEVGIKFE